MQQLSRPYQIALGALLVFALAWFTVLKPSASADEVAPLPGESPAATVPGAAGLNNAVTGAKGASAAADANAAAGQAAAAAASGEPAGTSTKPASVRPSRAPAARAKARAKRGSAPADPSAAILRDVKRGKVAVLLFFNPDAADDREVRRALRGVSRHGGRVVVRAAPISRVARYAAITRGVDVLQAPTLLVIGKSKRARTIVGFTDTREIEQLVADVGGKRFR